MTVLVVNWGVTPSSHTGLGLSVVFTDPLVVLLLLDLLHLVQQLSDSQLQLGEFVLRCDFRIVVGVFSHLNIQMHSLQHQENSQVEIYTIIVCGYLKKLVRSDKGVSLNVAIKFLPL